MVWILFFCLPVQLDILTGQSNYINFTHLYRHTVVQIGHCKFHPIHIIKVAYWLPFYVFIFSMCNKKKKKNLSCIKNDSAKLFQSLHTCSEKQTVQSSRILPQSLQFSLPYRLYLHKFCQTLHHSVVKN